MSEDRASRLRNRRNRAKDRATGGDDSTGSDGGAEQAETADVSEAGEPSKPSERDESVGADETGERGEAADSVEADEPAEADETADGSEETSVKDEQVGTYMYLPHAQKKELERTYNLLKAEYEFEFDEEFEKNRHFFPLVVRHGLDTLAEADAEDVPRLLEDV